jgi:hypothetical protein
MYCHELKTGLATGMIDLHSDIDRRMNRTSTDRGPTTSTDWRPPRIGWPHGSNKSTNGMTPRIKWTLRMGLLHGSNSTNRTNCTYHIHYESNGLYISYTLRIEQIVHYESNGLYITNLTNAGTLEGLTTRTWDSTDPADSTDSILVLHGSIISFVDP